IPETRELSGEDQVDQHHGEAEGHGKRPTLVPNLPRLSSVVDRHSRLGRGGLENAQAFFLGDAGADPAVHPDRVALLEPVQRPRRGARLYVRERGNWNEPASRRLDLEIEQRSDSRSVGIAELRDHLVAAVIIVETVHIAPAQHGAQLLAYAGELQPQVGDPLAI